MLKSRWTSLIATTALVLSTTLAQAQSAAAPAASAAPDVWIKQISGEVIDAVKSDKAIQAGDTKRILALVDAKILPGVDFQRMTAASVGRYWRQATPDQQKRLQDEFKTLLVRTYAGALTQVKDQTVELKPLRSKPEDTEVLVRSEIKGKGEPIQLDYRVEKSGDGWKIYDVNVLGVWLVESYRASFAQEIAASGIDGLITRLAEKNKAAAAKG
ncbi:MlaC/ttg2D family ABC transporter substrate-binding protein [Sphaerotilus sp.]|jgi:phospholipid transport system substrate-binding protein|uniref:MlaC/ttg2D family ABC transporter substrate-binding protein n=1 Tax=Sphaerotilus sp. TaxID=2093942 RepID=UPI0025EAFA2D|nr:ABC transporter substrate-binding protein [Sphaerotilus sp.]